MLFVYDRLLEILPSSSFFLFGARGTGKSTFLKSYFGQEVMWIDLLSKNEEHFYSDNPDGLSERLTQLSSLPEWVVIDEVQKVPELLDVVHSEIEQRDIKFALTGSSARKLKRGGANLLAGRAFLNHMFPLTHLELKDEFDLNHAINWGSLPGVFKFDSEVEKASFLEAYVEIYLKEEIFAEQLAKQVVPFRKFLMIAGQSSGTSLNFNKIARDIRVDWNTVRTYFEILEDTLLGFMLPAYDRSVRKQQLKSSKFYLFDVGVKKALDNTLTVNVTHGQPYGPLFEHFIIAEIYRLNSYFRKKYKLSYLATHGGLEIDLVVERPGEKTALIEIKSGQSIDSTQLRHLKAVISENPDEFEAYCFCRESMARTLDGVVIMPWRQGMKEIGLS